MTAARLSTIAAEAFGYELAEAQAAGELGFYARVFVQATMPHSRPSTNEYERVNGNLTLTMWAPRAIGLPYGSMPRLLLAWVTTEAVRTKERELILGDHLSGFMRQLDLMPTGGRWGTITRLREQMRRLFASTVSVHYVQPHAEAIATAAVADHAMLWWDPQQPDQAALWQSRVMLSETFFRSVIERPVPLDMTALKALKRSPLALDLYTWLTYRMSYLRQPVTIPWEALEVQFGADYANTWHFKPEAVAALAKVRRVYPGARFCATSTGVRLLPSPTHVARRHVIPT